MAHLPKARRTGDVRANLQIRRTRRQPSLFSKTLPHLPKIALGLDSDSSSSFVPSFFANRESTRGVACSWRNPQGSLISF